MRSYEIKHVRGVIVSTLGAYYPNGLTVWRVYEDALLPTFPTLELDHAMQQCAYLEQAGFVVAVGESSIRGQGSPRDRVYRLTPSGLDVAQGIKTDEAIQVD